MFQILQSDVQALMIVVGIFGLIVGSFLNVVIYRLPIMLQREWAQQCAEFSGQSIESQEIFNLSVPRSRCPHCGHLISALENIPIFSYIVLLGRCRECREKFHCVIRQLSY
ncbi:MAG: prepilin peptidase [Thiotrichaceae bacterium]